jgi:hypothetical protein
MSNDLSATTSLQQVLSGCGKADSDCNRSIKGAPERRESVNAVTLNCGR